MGHVPWEVLIDLRDVCTVFPKRLNKESFCISEIKMSVGLSVNTYGMLFPGSEIERHVLPDQSALSIQTAM